MLAQTLPLAALLALANAHGVILAAQGDFGSPPSVGFIVNDAIARNCTTINPCQMDSTIIRDAEIAAGTVNSCGRTKLTGNIDIGEVTENALAANAVTQVQSGSQMLVTIHQVNADGAGPYFCDLDEGSNTGVISHNLTVTNNIPGANGLSQAAAQDFNMTVAMPDAFKCVGGSTGNVCTVRCRNNAQAGPFGGCFAVQQTDTTPLPTANDPGNVATEESLEEINSEVASNQAALPAAVEANQKAGGAEAEQNLAAVNAILGLTTTLAEFPTQTPSVDVGGTTGAATPTGVVAGGAGAVGNGNAGGNAVGGGNGRSCGGNAGGNNLNNNGGAAGAGAGTGTGNGNANGNGASTGAGAGNAGANVNNGNAAGNGGNGGGNQRRG
ncbi:hypothetical protein C8A01DRAFT_39010 [Parachaetomium inaequale]|uniref:GEgh 16 protein n=1 Tax=Parachaetomium inaequale TaxID=2588326 RepID=A0AAN6SNU8_9PEZI|nr:hypothetical protein C8A01DRAFT_39010 [Parachaetomium inaequale]